MYNSKQSIIIYLMEVIMDNITRLTYKNKEVILIATAHVSNESVLLVEKVIDQEKPDSVCIELDKGRYDNIRNPKAWENMDIIRVIKEKKVGFLLINLALSSYQKKMAKKLGTTVGGEMLQGIKSADEIGANIVLADRDIRTTFSRIWRLLSAKEKFKLLYNILLMDEEDNDISEEDLQELLGKDVLDSMMSEMKKEFPKIGQVLIAERDQYLAHKIKNAPGEKVVAILGAAHVPGVEKEIFNEIDVNKITQIPPKGKFSKYGNWIIPGVIIALIIYSFFINFDTGIQQLSSWILWTGLLAAGFTALTFPHPLTIITAFVTAPLTTIHPLLACGWFAGIVEASVKKPTVKDINNITEDITSFKGFFRNRFLKTLMVVVFANIGATIGTFVAGTELIKNLF